MSEFENYMSSRTFSPQEKQKLKAAMNQIVNDMTVIDSYRAKIRDDIKALKEEFEIPLKYLRRMARIHYNRSFSEFMQENEEFASLYDSIMDEEKGA